MGTTYGEAHPDSEASYFGPSFMINWLHNDYGGFKAESILINCHYPVSQNTFVLQWGIIVKKPEGLDEKTTDKWREVFTEASARASCRTSRSGSTRPASTTRCWSRRTARCTSCVAGTSSSTSTSPMSRRT